LHATVQSIESLIEQAASIVWGPWLIILLFGTHLFLTWRTGFVQRHLFHAIKLSVTPEKGAPGDVSPFGSLTTALAATIGTGNIFGVAGAILIGGPGAVLWMWLTGVFGIATKYSEALLSVKYRVTNAQGQMCGGPMYVLEKGLQCRWAGIVFAVFTAIAAFGIGNMVQANTIAEIVAEHRADLPFSISENTLAASVGLVLAALTAAVMLGGITSIARFCSFLVPIMAAGYTLGCLAILVMNFTKLDETIVLIVKSAFTGHAAAGGFVGAGIAQAMRYGIARGLFSNESGMGSAPILAAAARTRDPVRQALVSGTGTFWDTVVVCAMTGLVLVSSGEWLGEDIDKAGLCAKAFGQLGVFGSAILVFGLVTFVFSTIIGWSYYGEKSVEYLFGTIAVKPYRWLWVAVVFLGSIWKSDAVWNFSDMMNGLMALPNLVALLLLSGVIASETRRYFESPRS
jgi:AGCS family alanine or glycine:cation symporter